MIDTKPAYKRQLETNVLVNISMAHLSQHDIEILERKMTKGESDPKEVLFDDDHQLLLKLSEEIKPSDISSFSQPVRQLLMSLHITGIRLFMFDVDAPEFEGQTSSEIWPNSSRKIMKYEENMGVVEQRIESNDFVMVIPSEAVFKEARHVDDLVQKYTEYDPITGREVLELFRKNGQEVYFA